MSSIRSFKDIIALWPTRAFFADEIGVTPGAAQQMELRDSINREHWERLIAAAAKLGRAEVDFPLLAGLQKQTRDQKRRLKRKRAA